MSRRSHQLLGRRFGCLLVTKQLPSKGKGTIWECRCDCGRRSSKHSGHLTRPTNPTKHCGFQCPIMRKEVVKKRSTHGMTGSPIYCVWRGMKKRCSDPRDKGWKYYGGRGIKVCLRWENSFENFFQDMGATYQRGLTIERKNNNGNYTPTNCKWATYSQNNRNKRCSLTHRGFPKNFQDIAYAKGIDKPCLYQRIRRGYNWEQVINTPMYVQLRIKPRKKYERKSVGA